MAKSDATFCQHLVVTGGQLKPVTWESPIQRVYISSVGGNVYVQFGPYTATTDSFLVISSSITVPIDIDNGSINTMSILGASGATDVYLLGIQK